MTQYKGETPFINIWARRQEFRSVVYYRAKIAQSKFTGGVNYRHEMAKVVGQSPGLNVSNLYLSCEEIGPGLYIEHGFSTIIFAKSIGRNFRVNQNVTIGTGKGGNPAILDNVHVRANCVVIGNITVSNGVKIGAGAVLNFEVPADSTVVSQKPRVIPPKII